jgi:histone acetyltransferase (RNA polymerase elongator complex component)
VREYNASDGTEMFLSAESKDMQKLFGFLRLRFPSNDKNDVFPELNHCALIRELHVYGQLQLVNTETNHVQHRGIGRQLLTLAENISKVKGRYMKCAVIAAEGTKNYYNKYGYVDAVGAGGYMVKDISSG